MEQKDAVTKQKKFPVWVIVAAVVVLVGIAAAVIAVAGSGTARKVSKQLELARKYAMELNYEQAIIAYEAVIKIDPKNTDAYLELADVYVEMGQPEKAEEVLKKAKGNVEKDDLKKINEKIEEVEKFKNLNTGDLRKTTSVPTQEETPEPSQEPTPEPTLEADDSEDQNETSYDMSQFREAKTGDIIVFGSYEQDNDLANGKEPIEWLVLSNDGKKLFVLSKYALDCQPYNTEVTEITWEECTLRKWLNDDFYNAAFSTSEKKLIRKTKIKNNDNLVEGTEYATKGGNDTKNKIFLLALEDMVNTAYGFSSDYSKDDIARRCAVTAYAKAQGAWSCEQKYNEEEWKINATADGEPTCYWWLRSPGCDEYPDNVCDYSYTASFVHYEGLVSCYGWSAANQGHYDHVGDYHPDVVHLAVRPAIVLDLTH